MPGLQCPTWPFLLQRPGKEFPCQLRLPLSCCDWGAFLKKEQALLQHSLWECLLSLARWEDEAFM